MKCGEVCQQHNIIKNIFGSSICMWRLILLYCTITGQKSYRYKTEKTVQKNRYGDWLNINHWPKTGSTRQV